MIRRFLGLPKRLPVFSRGYSLSARIHEMDTSSLNTPRLRPFIFSKKNEEINWKSLPHDTYPNPLFAMSTSDISDLKMDEYLHLINIPYKMIDETEQFCNNIVSVIEDIILTDPERATKYYDFIEDSEIQYKINTQLRGQVHRDIIKSTLVEMMIDQSSEKFRAQFFETLAYIFKLPEERYADALLSFLNKLTKFDKIIEEPLIMNSHLFEKVLRVMPRERFAELYAYLVHLNIQTYVLTHIEKLKHELLSGSNLEKLVAKTGLLNPKWHDIRNPKISGIHLNRMRNFFSVRDLARLATFSIEKKDIVLSNMYVSLLVTKFEKKCKLVTNADFKFRRGDSDIRTDITLLLKVLINHVMIFKGSHECLRMLEYMVQNNLKITFDVLIIVIRNLRRQGFFEEALSLMNNIRPESLSHAQRLLLTDQILCLIQAKYPISPKIMFGYVTSIFKDGNNLLNQLGLLGLVYQDGAVVQFQNPEVQVERANMDERLTGFDFTPKALVQVYEMCLLSLPKSTITPQFVKQLHDAYIRTIIEFDYPVFNKSRQSDEVTTLLIKYLLKMDTESSDMDIVASDTAYAICKEIIHDFSTCTANPVRRKRSPYLFDLLITSALTVHKDYNFATSMIRESRSLNLPFTFNQIYPFIMYHYEKKEYRQAELWYEQMVKYGVKCDSQPSKHVFKIARELGWDVKGVVYRKQGIKRNYKKKEELKKLLKDPIVFVGNDEISDDTDPVGSHTGDLLENPRRASFRDELLALVN